MPWSLPRHGCRRICPASSSAAKPRSKPQAGASNYLFQRAPTSSVRVGRRSFIRLRPPACTHHGRNGARIACAGGNYADHHLAMAKNRPGGSKEAEELTLQGVAESIRKSGFWGFWKVDRTCLGPDDEVNYPARAKYFDYEGEAAIVIGRQGKNIRARGLEVLRVGRHAFVRLEYSPKSRERPDEFRDAEEFRRLVFARAMHPGRRRCQQHRRDHDSQRPAPTELQHPRHGVFIWRNAWSFCPAT